METKDTFSSCSGLEEQEIQQLQKESFHRLFNADSGTFKDVLSQNMQNLERQLNKETLHEKDSNFGLSVTKVQFDNFIHSKMLEPFSYNSYDLETRQDFKAYTNMEAQTFKETIIQNMDSIEQCIVERAHHKQEIQNRLKRLNERKLQIQECKIQEVKASNSCSEDTDSSGIVSDKGNDQSLENQSNTSGDKSSRKRNECNEKSTSADDTDIRPSYDTEPMVEVLYIAEYNVFVVESQHSEQPKNINDTSLMEKVDSNTTPDSSDAYNEFQCLYHHKIKECDCLAEKLSKQTETVSKEVYNELSQSFAKLEEHLISLELALQQCQEQMKNDTVCKQNGSTVFLKERDQYFKIQDLKAYVQDKNIAISELKKLIEKIIGKSVDTNFEKQSILGKPPLQQIRNQPVSLHSWPQVRKSSFAKPYDVNAHGPSRKSPKHVSFQSPRESIGSNDMSARLPTTADRIKPKPRTFNQQPRNWQPFMSSHVSNRNVKIAKPPRNQKPFLKSKDLACPTCKKCIYSANHDECILKYLSKIPIGQIFSANKCSIVFLKTTPPRSGLTWKPMGRIFTQVGLKWIPIKKSVKTYYNTNDSAPPLGKETHNPNIVICANSSSLSAGVRRSESVFLKEREQYFKIQDLKAQLQDKNIAISELKKLIEKCKGKSVETKFDKPSVVRQPNAQRIPKPSVLGKPAPFSDSLERKSFSKTKSVPKTNVSEGLSKPVTTQILPQTARQAVRNTNVIKPGMYQIDTRTTQTRAPQLPQTSRNTNPRMSTSTGVIHRTNVSRPQLRSTQMKDKVMPNNSQVKFKKTEVEDHHRISSISNKTKSVTACNDSLKSRTLNVNDVCATCGNCVFNLNHDACVSKFLNDVEC
ncbi:hypothetical protein Tco_0496451 [Tanacetum coccineum]